MDELTTQYYNPQESDQVFLLLHGENNGFESPLMSQIFDALRAKGSVYAYNFPYIAKGGIPSEGLVDEVASFDQAIKFLVEEGKYQKIVVVGKSLGAIVASFWLTEHKPEVTMELVVMGYVRKSVKTAALKDTLKLVVQGAEDRFGNGGAIEQELANYGVEADVIEILGADHSYRPGHEAEAIMAIQE